ncbi:MAG: EAL domain-containing protein [Legionella sp.]|nr:EAL domain-containing protein [Legionella sp.]
MILQTSFKDVPELNCKNCKNSLDFDFTFAFQPIVNVKEQTIFAYEALVRGLKGETAKEILSLVNDTNRYSFDQACRTRSIHLAKKLDMKEHLSINFMPDAIYKPELCIRSTIAAAEQVNFPLNKIIFEVNEEQNVLEPDRLVGIFKFYREKGFATAMDDFGSGYAGLALLADFQPDIIKIDIKLVRNIHVDKIKQAIVEGIITTCDALQIQILAEGIEQFEEAQWFYQHGIFLMQGFYFAKPGYEMLPTVTNLMKDFN